MADVTPSGKEAVVAVARQTAKDTVPTAFYGLRLEEFSPAPDIVYDEPAAEMGSGSLDKAAQERLGHNGVPFTMSGRFRPGNNLHLIADLGFDVYSGGFVLFTGVNASIYVTDDAAGPTEVNILSNSGATSGQHYSAAQFATYLQTALNAVMSDTFTVTYSTSTNKFTIASDGASTLSLHWTSCEMLANLLGYDETADDTGAFSYESDDARVPIGRVQIRSGINDQIYVDEGTPATVNVLSGTGAVGVAKEPYSPWSLCAVIAAALNGDTSLSNTYTMFYDTATDLFTLESSASMDFPWTNAACTIAASLGYTTDDTSTTSSVSDQIVKAAPKWIARPLNSASSFPWYSILAKANSSAWLDLIYKDCRINSLTIDGANKSALQMSLNGRSMDWTEAAGTETVTADDTTYLKAPNTDDPAGSIKMAGTEFRMAAVNWSIGWEEITEPQCVEGEPYSVNPADRTVGMTCDIYLGADEGDLYRKVFMGGASGTDPSTTIVEEDIDVWFVAGQVVPNQTNATDRYGFRWEADDAQLINYPLSFAGGDLDHADLEVNIKPESASDYTMTFVCNISDPDALLAA